MPLWCFVARFVPFMRFSFQGVCSLNGTISHLTVSGMQVLYADYQGRFCPGCMSTLGMGEVAVTGLQCSMDLLS